MPLLPRRRQSPTRQVTGTSYEARGNVDPPAVSYRELGSSAAGIMPESVPELVGTYQQLRAWTKMVRSDVSVRTSLRAGKAPILGAEYYLEPFDDQPINQSILEFVDYNIFYGMMIPFGITLNQICTFMEKGYSVFEPVWELREWAPKKTSPGANRRVYTMLKKLAIRPVMSLSNHQYDDNGELLSIDQAAIRQQGRAETVTLKANNLVIFTFDKEENDVTGNSILRSAYRHWFYKDKFYSIDGIQKERHGMGVPDIELQPGHTEADRTAAHELGRNLRTNEYGYIVRTTNMKVGFAEMKTQPADALASAGHHDDMIMKNIMVQFLNMGVGESGSRAVGATAMDMFLKAMKFIAHDLICDVWNADIIPKLVAYNFRTDQFPTLRVRNIGETRDLQMWAAAMANLVDKGLITMDLESEQWCRRQLDMPKKLGERPTKPAPDASNPNQSGGASRNGGGTGVTTGNVGRSANSAN